MENQHYKNHSRFVPLYHYVATVLLLLLMIGSVVNLIHASADNKFSAWLIIVITIVLILLWVFSRTFALKAQDRAIRAEEHFRHYILTGKTANSALTINQIIALRFASDEELPALAKKAIDENLSPKQIKEAIQQWKADHHRA